MNLRAGIREKRRWGKNDVKKGGWVWHSFVMTRFNPIFPVEPLRDFSRGARWLDLTTWLYCGKWVKGKSLLRASTRTLNTYFVWAWVSERTNNWGSSHPTVPKVVESVLTLWPEGIVSFHRDVWSALLNFQALLRVIHRPLMRGCAMLLLLSISELSIFPLPVSKEPVRCPSPPSSLLKLLASVCSSRIRKVCKGEDQHRRSSSLSVCNCYGHTGVYNILAVFAVTSTKWWDTAK